MAKRMIATRKPKDTIESVRLDAQLAYLDNRVARAKALNRLAGAMARKQASV